ncbi:PATL5 [Linum grandiflorum]
MFLFLILFGAAIRPSSDQPFHPLLQVCCYQPILMVLQQKEIIALQQFKQLLIDEKSRSPDSASDEIYFCGVRLELDAIDDGTDVILLKFLRAKDFEVEDAFKMFSRAILWRKKFGIDKLLLEDEDDEYSKAFEKVFFMSGRSREGHPMCYMVCGAFLDKELYDEAFSDEVKKERFLKWRIMFIEKTMRKLDFRDGGISSIILVINRENSYDLERTAFEALKSMNRSLLSYYPEFVERRILINLSWLSTTLMRIRNAFSAPGRFDKLVVAGRSGSRETLLRYVDEEQIPTRCESITKRDDGEFEAWDAATEVILKGTTKHNIVVESCKLRCRIKSTRGKMFYCEDKFSVQKQRFLKWRIMFIERTMRKLNFRAGGISSIVHVIDMKNFSGLDKTSSKAFRSTLRLLFNYYPDFVERQIMINVP